VHLGIGQVIPYTAMAAEPGTQAALATPVCTAVTVCGDSLKRQPGGGDRADVLEAR